MKRLVVCCDGTWNTDDQRHPTNVPRFRDSVAPVDPAGTVQRAEHFDGVGTGFLEHLTGGAFGAGLSEKVLQAYRWVIDHFDPGDELYFLGFSRGAYTARSTVGLIRNCGVLRRDARERVDEAYALYRRRDEASGPDAPEAAEFRRLHAHTTGIRFVGVWDTVGSLGVPFSGSTLVRWINRPWQFHDTKLSSTVEHARQALAIDERRRPYEPAVWEPPLTGEVPRRQVWFPGVHSDVGGGYADRGLADVTLRWMVAGAADAGLAFLPGTPGAPAAATASVGATVPGGTTGSGPSTTATATSTSAAPAPSRSTATACPTIHDSMSWAFRLLVPFTRVIGRTDPTAEAAASTAVTRMNTADCRYSPENLRDYLGSPTSRVEVV